MSEKDEDLTLKQRIYRELRRSIITGRRLPGDKLNIQMISQQYDTSITPIREALHMLSQEGLVSVKPHSGYLVTQLTVKELRDLLDLREILELAAVGRAVDRITDEQIQELEQVCAGYTGDGELYERHAEENRRLHYLIAQATGNQELARALAHLYDRLARFLILCHTGETMQSTHIRLVEALRARGEEAARRIMQDELTRSREMILERVIQEQGDSWRLGTGI